MNNIAERFVNFLKNEKTQSSLAFITYFLFIRIFLFDTNYLPSILQVAYCIASIIVVMLGMFIFVQYDFEKTLNPKKVKISKKIIHEFNKIAKEILMYIPVLSSSIFICTFSFAYGEPKNQSIVVEKFKQYDIFSLILIIIIVAIIEEFICRFLPYKFIKNKALYIFASSFIFAAFHVIDDSKAFYNIWIYMYQALYYAYRYYKTEDLWVSISLHILNNFVAALLTVF